MCDICSLKCACCDVYLPVHLGDFDTERDEVMVFCKDHIPDHDVRVFTLLEDDLYEETEPALILYPKGWKMGIRYLTENAEKNKDMNFPNTYNEPAIEDRV
jgi:hypothetical protein